MTGLDTNSIFFRFLFVKKLLICLEGKSMTPHWGNTILFRSSQQLPLEGLFELTRRPSWALDLPRALLSELQRYKDTVRCAVLGAEVSGHQQQQLRQTLIVRLLKTHFLTLILDFEKSTE